MLNSNHENAAPLVSESCPSIYPPLAYENPKIDWMPKLDNYIRDVDYVGAVNFLRSSGKGPDEQNAIGVCLMRLGKIEESVATLKDLVIVRNSLFERPDVPAHFRRNFATALLLYQRVSGCLELLQTDVHYQNPVALSLIQTIKDWEKSLSLWQWLNWKIYSVIPKDRPIRLAFVPGEFTS